jgi:hypothetical protein
VAVNDYAIVIGIAHYPFLRPLEGPVEDAIAMREWLVGPGGVPDAQVKLVISQEPPAPAKPILDEVDDAFTYIFDLATAQQPARRLYFYFAGHGCTSYAADSELVIIMVNARLDQLNRSLNTHSVHQGLKVHALFPEQVMFYDCCRNYDSRVVGRIPSWSTDAPTAAAANVTQVIFTGSRFTEYAYERRMDDGFQRGLFTKALLEGLHGDAAAKRGPQWLVTPDSLNAQLELRVPELAQSFGLQQRPEPIFSGDYRRLVLATLDQPVKFAITVRVPRADGEVIVEDHDLVEVARVRAQGHEAHLQLVTGLYAVRTDDQPEAVPFKITRGQPHTIDLGSSAPR